MILEVADIRIQPGKTVEQAHMRGRAMVSHWVYEKGKPETVIERVAKREYVAALGGDDRALAVERNAQRVDHAADHGIAHRHAQ